MRYRSVNSQTCSRETGSAFALFTKGYNSPDHCGAVRITAAQSGSLRRAESAT